MTTGLQSIPLTFVTDNPAEADAIVAALRAFAASPVSLGAVLDDLDIQHPPGAVSTEKIVAVVLTVSINLSYGVVGNFIYDALKDKPNAECVVGKKPLSAAATQDRAAIESAVREAAAPVNRTHGH